MDALSAGQKQEFLAQLLMEEPLSKTAIAKMQSVYNFNDVKNCEILFRYLSLKYHVLLLKSDYQHLLFKVVTIMS